MIVFTCSIFVLWAQRYDTFFDLSTPFFLFLLFFKKIIFLRWNTKHPEEIYWINTII